MKVTEYLVSLKDQSCADFTAKLIPSIEKQKVLGIKTPVLKKLAKTLVNTPDGWDFLKSLPHYYLEENNLHMYLIGCQKDFYTVINLIEDFLPFVDNWATCDGLSPTIFKKHKQELLLYIKKWLSSNKVYTVRFGVRMLMCYYLDDDFSPDILNMVKDINSQEYYVNMMISWFFATALAKQYDATIKYFTHPCLNTFCHNKAIQKALESFRVGEEHKQYLKTLKL